MAVVERRTTGEGRVSRLIQKTVNLLQKKPIEGSNNWRLSEEYRLSAKKVRGELLMGLKNIGIRVEDEIVVLFAFDEESSPFIVRCKAPDKANPNHFGPISIEEVGFEREAGFYNGQPHRIRGMFPENNEPYFLITLQGGEEIIGTPKKDPLYTEGEVEKISSYLSTGEFCTPFEEEAKGFLKTYTEMPDEEKRE
ncbi:hypothetical protein C4559_04880 [Candidatus Microgenomates bacterium]|nr:MAG: hypothetical protein C4559_04880 [Candidatus Microgenomates bacterium]